MRSKNPYSYNSGEIALDEAKDLPKEFYDCFERCTDNNTDCHVHYTSTTNKCLEFFNKFFHKFLSPFISNKFM